MLLKGLLQQLEFCISRITMLLASKVWGSCRQAALCISPLLTDIKDVGSGMNQSHVSPLLMLKRETGSPCLPLVWISMAHSLVYSPPPPPPTPSFWHQSVAVWHAFKTPCLSLFWHQRCLSLRWYYHIFLLASEVWGPSRQPKHCVAFCFLFNHMKGVGFWSTTLHLLFLFVLLCQVSVH